MAAPTPSTRRSRHERRDPADLDRVNLRYLRVLRRQPAYLGITLTQPIIWLLLFGALFKAVTEIPGFHGDSSTSTSSRPASS